jgi:hypothetical protein
MRERYLEAFDEVWIGLLNGDACKTGKRTPEGEPDPSVFSTRSNTAGSATPTTGLQRNSASSPPRVANRRWRWRWPSSWTLAPRPRNWAQEGCSQKVPLYKLFF